MPFVLEDEEDEAPARAGRFVLEEPEPPRPGLLASALRQLTAPESPAVSAQPRPPYGGPGPAAAVPPQSPSAAIRRPPTDAELRAESWAPALAPPPPPLPTSPRVPAVDLGTLRAAVAAKPMLERLAPERPEPAISAAPEARRLPVRPEDIYTPEALAEIGRRGDVAREVGIPEEAKPIGQAMIGFGNAMSLGLIPLARYLAGMPPQEEPRDVAGGVARGAGQLAGFIGLPAKVGAAITERLFSPYVTIKPTDAVGRAMIRMIGREMATLGLAVPLERAGERVATGLKEGAVEAAKGVGQDIASGASLGAVFGATRGVIPDADLLGRAARIATGNMLIDLLQGTRPTDDRALAEKVFGYGLNTFFLFRGVDPQQVIRALNAEAESQGITPEAALRTRLEIASERAEALLRASPEADRTQVIREQMEEERRDLLSAAGAGLARRGIAPVEATERTIAQAAERGRLEAARPPFEGAPPPPPGGPLRTAREIAGVPPEAPLAPPAAPPPPVPEAPARTVPPAAPAIPPEAILPEPAPVAPPEKLPREAKAEVPPATPEAAKPPWQLSGADLVDVKRPAFPKGSFRGELKDAQNNFIANVYLVEGRVYIGLPREFGRGEIVKMLPGSFEAKDFEKAGGLQVSATRRVQFYRFKKPGEAVVVPEVGLPKPTPLAEAVTALGRAEGLDPTDPAQLVRFVRTRGGLAPSPTGDLTGEYWAVPLYVKNRRGLSPDLMAQAVSEAAGRPVSDAELLGLLGRKGRLTAEAQARERAEAAAPERAAEAEQQARDLAALPEDEKIRRITAMTGMTEQEARQTLARPLPEPAEPVEAEPLRLATDPVEALDRGFAAPPDSAEHRQALDLMDALAEWIDAAGDLPGARQRPEREVITPGRRGLAPLALTPEQQRAIVEYAFPAGAGAEPGGVPEAAGAGARRPDVAPPAPAEAPRGPEAPGPALGESERAAEAPAVAPAPEVVEPRVGEERAAFHRRRSQADQLRQYEAEQGITPPTVDPLAGLRDTAADLDRRLATWRTQRERALERITGENPEAARTTLAKIDAEIADLNAQQAQLRWIIAAQEQRQAEAPPAYERTPLGEQALIPGTEAREIPTTPLRPEVPQRPVGETPLFRGEPETEQPRLPGVEEPSAAYETARAEDRAAQAEYRAAVTAYRAGRMSDADFLAAKAKYEKATVAFDAAFEAESRRREPRPSSEAEQPRLPGVEEERSAFRRAEEPQEPYRINSKEELENLEFQVPSGGASLTPKRAFRIRASGEFETLADLARYEDQWRFEEVLGGKGWERATGIPASLNLAEAIKRGESVTVYRAVDPELPKGILPGAYVTESRRYAEHHGEAVLRGAYEIESFRVPPDELMVYGDPHEFIYLPKDAETAFQRLQAGRDRRPAPATFAFYQEVRGREPLAQYHLTETIPGHPEGSTVSPETLREAGYEVPETPSFEAWQRTRGVGEEPARYEAPAPPFFSQLQRVIEQKMPERAFAPQIEAIVRSGAVKADEVKWTGLDDWLRAQGGRKVTKPEVLDFLRQNEVRVEEVTKGAPSPRLEELSASIDAAGAEWREARDAIQRYLQKKGIDPAVAFQYATDLGNEKPGSFDAVNRILRTGEPSGDIRTEFRVMNPINRLIDANRKHRELQREHERIAAEAPTTKFARYVLPGAAPGTYRELLLTLPVRVDVGAMHAAGVRLNTANNAIGDYVRGHPGAVPARDADLARLTEARDRIEEEMRATRREGYRSPHWDEPNVLAHVRFNERTDAEGKRVLFIEELQSDWHQEGRRKGYQRPVAELPEGYRTQEAALAWLVRDPSGEVIGRGTSEQDAIKHALRVLSGSGVPEAPFAKTWHELAMKRMLRYAAEQGYDRVGLITGEMQTERYDLSKHIGSITWWRLPDGDYGIRAVGLRGGEIEGLRNRRVAPNELADVIGKELADKILASSDTEGTFEGLDLKVGGEGMKGFYDQILPAFLNQYGKKWGARVGTAEVSAGGKERVDFIVTRNPFPRAGEAAWEVQTDRQTLTFPTEQAAREWVKANKESVTLRVPALDITPAMRRSVLEEGQPLFLAMRRPEESDVSWNQRWKRAFTPSWQAGVRLPGSPFRLTDTLTERSPEALARFADDVEYLAGLGNAIEPAVEGMQARLGPDWRRADFAGFDTGLDDLGVNLPASLVGGERNQILINPWGVLAEAQRRYEHEPRVSLAQWFGEELAETVAHEVSHQRFRDHRFVFEATVDWVRRQAEEPLAALSVQGQRWLEEGETHARFTRDSERLRAVRRPGAPAGAPEGPADIAFGAGAEIRDVGRRPLAGLGARPPEPGAAGGVRPEGDLERGGERREGALPVGAAPAVQLPGGGPAFRSRLIAALRSERGSTFEADPSLLRDLAEYGREVRRAHPDYEGWAAALRRELGPRVEPHLGRAWEEMRRGAPTPTRPSEPEPAEPEPRSVRPSVARPVRAATIDLNRTIPPAVERIRKRATKFAADLKQVRGRLIPEAEVVEREAEIIGETGTLAPETRKPFREEVAPKPETFTKRVSEQDIADTQTAIVALAREYRQLRVDVEQAADPFAQNTARTVQGLLGQAQAGLNALAREFRAQRFAAGRSVKRFDRPVPEDVLAALQEAGVMTEWLGRAKPRLPIYTNIVRSLRHFPSLTQPERRQFVRDLVDAWRLNLFSVTSWTLDFVGNASELSMQVVGGMGRDVVQVARGAPNFPSLQGLFRALRDRALHVGEPIAEKLEAGLGTTIGGERVSGGFTGALTGERPGTFTTRQGVPSRSLDLLVGVPLYAKGVFDTGAKRLMATATVWRDAIEEANRQGLSRHDRRAFYREFLANIPEATEQRAIEAGNKAGFNRSLSEFEERIAGSTLVRLLGDVFARWPFQFTRTMGEWLGYNPSLFRDVAAGRASAEQIAAWLVMTATGWGALYLLNDTLYDRVDFNSMEYVHEDGNRTRFSNRDPLPTALWLLATIKGDVTRSTGALRYASIPGARLLSGEGGLLGGLVSTFTKASARADLDAGAMTRELTNLVNRVIPGQAVLSALESIFDPVIQEGIGANIPGVSSFLEPAIKRTTGEPLEPRQKVLGVEIPTVAGTPIPGAQRVLDPVERLLSRYGLLIYRGPKSPIAGLPPKEIPREILREWLVEFGRQRQQRLGPLAERMDQGQFDQRNPDQVRALVQARDTLAAESATNAINRRYGRRLKLPRQPTIRERRGPVEFEAERQRFVPEAVP